MCYVFTEMYYLCEEIWSRTMKSIYTEFSAHENEKVPVEELGHELKEIVVKSSSGDSIVSVTPVTPVVPAVPHGTPKSSPPSSEEWGNWSSDESDEYCVVKFEGRKED